METQDKGQRHVDIVLMKEAKLIDEETLQKEYKRLQIRVFKSEEGKESVNVQILRHIVENYNNLPDNMVFVSSIMDYEQPQFAKLMLNEKLNAEKMSIAYREDMGKQIEKNKIYNYQQTFEYLFQRPFDQCCSLGIGYLAIGKGPIQKYKRSFYVRLLDFISREESQLSHIEYIWGFLFFQNLRKTIGSPPRLIQLNKFEQILDIENLDIPADIIMTYGEIKQQISLNQNQASWEDHSLFILPARTGFITKITLKQHANILHVFFNDIEYMIFRPVYDKITFSVPRGKILKIKTNI